MSRTKLSLEDAMAMSTEDIVASFEALDRMRSLAEERAGSVASERERIIRVVHSVSKGISLTASTDSERSIVARFVSEMIRGIDGAE